MEVAKFFDRGIHDVAKDLLGRDLVRRLGSTIRRGRIVEVEVYEGANDRASHARSGRPTERTAPMFAEPGTIYVYTIYGIYQCLNLRAPSGVGPGAILIRACAPMGDPVPMAMSRGLIQSPEEYRASMAKKLMSGPGKLCQAMEIGPQLSGAVMGSELWLEAGEPVWEREPQSLVATPRVGLNPKTCLGCEERLWRYVIAGSRWLSR